MFFDSFVQRAEMMYCRQHRRALTLVELLVIIAIIGILLALLLPAIMKLRLLADDQEEKNQLRVLGHAWLAYARAHQGRPVNHRGSDPFDRWIHKLSSYGELNDALISPADPLKEERRKYLSANPNRFCSSYVLNPYFSTSITDSVTGKQLSCERLSDCTSLSRALAILPVSPHAGVPGPGYIFPQGWLIPKATAWQRTTGRLGIQPDRFPLYGEAMPGRSNYFYADGHVESVPADMIKNWIDAGHQFLMPQQ